MDQKDYKPVIDELSEVLFILIVNSNNIIEKSNEWNNIIDNVKLIANLKVTDKLSLTNKSIFKHMDILDELN